jgi:asparagine synthase (glutamine-hydrolysing)
MCGICGFYGFENKILIKKMSSLMKYRGPDDYGYYNNEVISLGHRRLSIIDLKTGKQPMKKDDGNLIIVFNGEIYNFKEIRTELENKGYEFETNSDTEVLLLSYKEYGIDCLKRFNGMFSFALYDKKRKKLILACDRIGIKPVYYHLDKEKFVFCSELKPLIRSKLVKPKIEKSALDFYLALGYLPAPMTFIEDIKKLEPGHYIEIDSKLNIKKKRYWSIDNISDKNQTKNKIIKNLDHLIGKSVRYNLISDVPTGIFLSGGIDSNVLLSYICKFTKEKVKVFTIIFPESSYFNEKKLAKLSPLKYDCKQKFISLRKDEFNKNLNEVLHHLDEPIGDSSIYLAYLISKESRKDITVALSGAGGDELFAGYRRYQGYKISKIVKPLACLIPKFSDNKNLMKRSNFIEDIIRSIKIIFSSAKKEFSDQFISYFFIFDNSLRKSILITSSDNSPERFLKNEMKKLKGSELKKMMKFDIKYYLPSDILLLTDKMSMQNSQEVRVPLLDHNLVEYALTIPDKYLISAFSAKKIFKEYAKKIVPKKILNSNKKRGFSIPLSNWFSESFKADLINIFERKKIIKQGLFDPEFISKMIESHFSDKADYSLQLFSLYAFQVWYDSIIK